MIQRMRSNLWIIAIHATLIPFVFFFCLLSWSMGATLPALYAATWISAGCTLVGLAAIILDGVCYHYGIGERLNAFFVEARCAVQVGTIGLGIFAFITGPVWLTMVVVYLMEVTS